MLTTGHGVCKGVSRGTWHSQHRASRSCILGARFMRSRNLAVSSSLCLSLTAYTPAGSLLIDCSTIAPETARLVAQKVADKGGSIDFVDAPVSGGTIGAENATLTFMVGGPDAAFKRSQDVTANAPPG
jgi:hypothetical protein